MIGAGYTLCYDLMATQSQNDDRCIQCAAAAVEDLSSVAASAALIGCARLGVQPGPGVVQACWAAVLQGGSGDIQSVYNTLWALSILEVSVPPIFFCTDKVR